MICSSSRGISALNCQGETEDLFRMASKITPEVRPENACWPVAISYSTAPKENRSVRPSKSSPRTCSGDIYATVPKAKPGLVSDSCDIEDMGSPQVPAASAT